MAKALLWARDRYPRHFSRPTDRSGWKFDDGSMMEFLNAAGDGDSSPDGEEYDKFNAYEMINHDRRKSTVSEACAQTREHHELLIFFRRFLDTTPAITCAWTGGNSNACTKNSKHLLDWHVETVFPHLALLLSSFSDCSRGLDPLCAHQNLCCRPATGILDSGRPVRVRRRVTPRDHVP